MTQSATTKKHFRFKTFLLICFMCVVGLSVWLHITYGPKKIAVIYIATGRYMTFWDKFYQSAETYFLPRHQKHYFVFTDDMITPFSDKVTKINRQFHGFPKDAIDRFDMIFSIREQLKDFDYIYFLNANAEFVGYVNEEIFPSVRQGIIATWHPAYYRHQNPYDYPYDRQPQSTAYIPMGSGYMYAQSGFIGGRQKDFLTLCHILADHVRINQKNRIMARWHDESHFNHYILDKKPLILTPNYIWAPFDKSLIDEYENNLKIIMRIKNTPEYGSTDYLRGKTNQKLPPDLARLEPIYHQLTDTQKATAIPVKTSDWTDYLIREYGSVFCQSKQPSVCGTVRKDGAKLLIQWEAGQQDIFLFQPASKMYILKNDTP
ncbi:MAG: hypothetical protein IJY58_01045 [Alphaproteobacteria bacterium]|nr:hypothetical protein [Alphaproteobacteria bacterium]